MLPPGRNKPNGRELQQHERGIHAARLELAPRAGVELRSVQGLPGRCGRAWVRRGEPCAVPNRGLQAAHGGAYTRLRVLEGESSGTKTRIRGDAGMPQPRTT